MKIKKHISPEDLNKILKCLPVLDLLSERPLQKVLFINQCATALRFKMLFNALAKGIDDVKSQNQTLYLYGEGSCITGYVGAFRDIAIKYHFLSRYHNKRSFSKKALLYGFGSLKIARLVGDIPGIKRMAELLPIFILFS
jgi:hypothetical protein